MINNWFIIKIIIIINFLVSLSSQKNVFAVLKIRVISNLIKAFRIINLINLR